MLRAMGFAQYTDHSDFNELARWGKELLTTDKRESLVSIVVLDEHGRVKLTLAEIERDDSGPEFTLLRSKEIIDRFSGD